MNVTPNPKCQAGAMAVRIGNQKEQTVPPHAHGQARLVKAGGLAVLLIGLGVWLGVKMWGNSPGPLITAQRSAVGKLQLLRTNVTTTEISLTPDELGGLIGKAWPRSGPHKQFSVGIFSTENPEWQAQEFAWRLRQLEEAAGARLGAPLACGLTLFRRAIPPAEMLAPGKADFVLLDALAWLEVRDKLPGATLLAREAKSNQVIIFTHQRTRLRDLKQLREARLALPDARYSIPTLAKARLAGAGVLAANLRDCTAYTDRSPAQSSDGKPVISLRETMARVYEGKFEVGVTSQSYLQDMNPPGIVILDSFPDAPLVVVARPGLPPKTVQAFRQALLSLKQSKPPAGMPRMAMMEYAPVQESDFDQLRQAIEAAAKFDGNHPQ